MPPKRHTPALTTKSSQSTLAFHGASNKVTKPGARAHGAKKGLLSDTKIRALTPEVVDVNDEPAAASTPEEDAARRLTESSLHKYWAVKEARRKAPRVHQADLGVHEKMLREFDMSAHYGPCTGIARLTRWNRAQRLALDPPLEVLAVLLQEQERQGEAKDRLAYQRSIVDGLLNAKTDLDG